MPDPVTITGTISPLTGVISGASLSIAPYLSTNATGTTNVTFSEVNPGTATGTINSNGDVTISDALQVELGVLEPIQAQCVTSPINVILQSTGSYDPSTGNVTLSQTNFTIPDFSAAPNCATPQSTLNGVSANGYAGSVGNNLTLALQGTLPIPPPPGAPSVSTLTVTPPSPQLDLILTQSSVTMTDTITTTASPPPSDEATGTVQFFDNGTLLSTQPVTNGSASFTSSTLPDTTNQLTAVYSGDFNYAQSTSPAVPYVIQPVPTISANLPSSIAPGTGSFPTPTPFTLTITDPSNGATYDNDLIISPSVLSFGNGSDGSNVELSYQDSSGNWCPVDMSDSGNAPGQYGNAAGYLTGIGVSGCGFTPGISLNPGQTLTVPLEISFNEDGDNGPLNLYGSVPGGFGFQLGTGTCQDADHCTTAPPFDGQENVLPNGFWLNFPGSISLTPPSLYPTTMSSTIFPTYTVPQGFVVVPGIEVNPPSTPSGLPALTGTMQYLVDGNIVPALFNTSSDGLTHSFESFPYSTGSLGLAKFSTAGLSVGTHTFQAVYSGDSVFAGATYTTTFTVGIPPTGTPYTCIYNAADGTFYGSAGVTVQATLPASAPAGTSVPINNLDVTLNVDAESAFAPNNFNPQATDQFGLSTGGTVTGSSVTPTVTNQTTTATWTGMSGTTYTSRGVPVTPSM